MRTEHVYCCDCGKELAYWGGGFNYQYEDEWACDNKRLRRRVPPGVVKTKHSVTITMDGGESTFRSEDKGGLKYEYLHCSISNKSVYCGKCARKRHYHCKNCRTGRIKLERKAR
jgi:hypothetical protein